MLEHPSINCKDTVLKTVTVHTSSFSVHVFEIAIWKKNLVTITKN